MSTSRPGAPGADQSRAGGPGSVATLVAAACVAAAAFALYRSTLLPGVDLGDSGSFQTTVGTPFLTPRVGYPLYFAIGGVFLRITGLAPALALNLVTAIEGALAIGLFVMVAARLSRSLPAAAATALLFAVSYTFWSQSVTAEVYALHLACMLASLLLLLAWEETPTPARLTAFFLVFAIGFGNHLSMVLLLPAFTVFLLSAAPGGWRTMLRTRVVLTALACAALGAAQYLWNLRTLWFQLDPPASISAALATFWFDVTKSDWRDTMVLEVPRSLLRDHAAMYWFDLRQQFGIVGPVLAGIGAFALFRAERRRAVLLLLTFATCFGFAFSYNVGDTHVFYLPSHLTVALLAAAGIASFGRMHRRGAPIAAIVLALYAGARAWTDYPALDRSRDTRAGDLLAGMTDGLDDRRDIFLVDLNWQVANGLSYYTSAVRPDIATARIRDVLLYAPALIADNRAIGRSAALSPQARRILGESYGPLAEAEETTAPASFESFARSIAPGTRYAVAVLKPSRDLAFTGDVLRSGLAVLGGGPVELPAGDYAIVAGLAGLPPTLVAAADRPFTRSADVAGTPLTVRMESWLSSDTIRRMGFGHVIVNRHHTLIVERGISAAAFDASGQPSRTAYFNGIFETPARYLIR